MDPQTAIEKVTRLLLDLGDTPDLVALTLQAQGITGHRNSVAGCPVARYLERSLGQRVSVISWSPQRFEIESFEIEPSPLDMTQPPWTVAPPAPVRDFIIDFDKGHHPRPPPLIQWR
jgi:hypothetical protein